MIGHAVEQSNEGVAYHWGNQMELNNYLKVGKSQSQINAIEIAGKPIWKQYPLVWFVKPAPTQSTDDGLIYRVLNARIVIAVNSPDLSKLNTEREKHTFPKIVPIADSLLSYFKRAQVVRFENQQNPVFSYDKVANYSTTQNASNTAIDIWDAIVIEANLLFNINCLSLTENICDSRIL